jgi:hypothetical protein
MRRSEAREAGWLRYSGFVILSSFTFGFRHFFPYDTGAVTKD